MSIEHPMGEQLSYIKPLEYNLLINTFLNENLSEKAKFLCYSFLIGNLITENKKLDNALKNENYKINNPWKIKIDALIEWYSDIFTEQEIIEGFKELQKNNHYIFFDVEKVLLNERKKLNE